MKPKLRFKEFSGDWESKRLGDITKLTDGVHFTPTYVDYGVPFWSVETVVSNASPKYITKEAHNEAIKRCNPQINDILLTRIGTLAKPKLIDWNEEFSIYVSLALIKSSNKYNSKFAKHYFETNYYKRDFLSKSLLTATPMKINMEDLKQTKIKLPSLEEQEKIASFLSLVDERINLQNKKLEALKEYKKGVMQKIFKKEIRFKDDNGNNYPDWEEKKLGEILSIPIKIKENNIFKDRLLTVKLHRKGVQVSENTETLNIGSTIYYKRKAGQLIYGKQNFFNGAIDIIPNKFDGFISSGDVPSLDINNKIANSNFILNYIGRGIFYKKTKSLAIGTGSKRLHENILFEIKINLPCLDEQIKISSFLSLIDEKIEKETKKLNLLNDYKKGLLQKMFV